MKSHSFRLQYYKQNSQVAGRCKIEEDFHTWKMLSFPKSFFAISKLIKRACLFQMDITFVLNLNHIFSCLKILNFNLFLSKKCSESISSPKKSLNITDGKTLWTHQVFFLIFHRFSSWFLHCLKTMYFWENLKKNVLNVKITWKTTLLRIIAD